MVYSLTYRRPSYVPSNHSSTAKSSAVASLGSSSTSSSPSGIPDALSFERVISGGVCPPCTVRDFMNYLIYLERSAENLQFHLWFTDYVKRFNNLPPHEKALSPPWTVEKTEAVAHLPKSSAFDKSDAEMAAILKVADFSGAEITFIEKPMANPFKDDDGQSSKWDGDASTIYSSVKADSKRNASAAFEAVDIKLLPFTVQPFREEITRIISIYIADGASRQLNLASRERTELLQALSVTTHPSAFHQVAKTVKWALRHQAHPNFVRWTICNGNRPRVVFARVLGLVTVIVGLVQLVIMTLSPIDRGWRAIAAIPLFIGVATLFAAWKGMCIVLHGMHHRHLRPWELFSDGEHPTAGEVYEMHLDPRDSVGSSNSYEDEPWVAKWEKRSLLRKVFDREVWIQEPALRQIQDTIFLQAILTALAVSGVLVGLFEVIPQARKALA